MNLDKTIAALQSSYAANRSAHEQQPTKRNDMADTADRFWADEQMRLKILEVLKAMAYERGYREDNQ